jgi:antirestriction protein ArdC
MNNNVQTVIDSSLQRLSEALAAGRSETLTEYLRAMARFHAYSWFNVMLIFMQRPSATRVAGYKTWKKVGRWVRRGEKGIVILAPMLKKDDEGDTNVFGFKPVRVYDFAQTDGRKMPEFDSVHGDPAHFYSSLVKLAWDQSIEVEYADDLDGADGVSMGGKVQILESLRPADRFSVLAHELAHELMHKKECDKDLKTKELEAEAVAFVVSSVIGLSSRSRSADYISLWGGDDKKLADSLKSIQQTSAFILSALI